MNNEINGARKANIYHNILHLLFDTFLNDFMKKVSIDNVMKHPDKIENLCIKITSAIKILYGYNYIIEEDLLDEQIWQGNSLAEW